MAIEFVSTSVSDADAVAAGILAQSAIRDALLAHASGAWTLVEEFDSAGATIHWVVLKCSDADSDVGFDFHVCIPRLASTGQIGMCVGETYDPALNTLSVYAPKSGQYYQNGIIADGVYAKDANNVAAGFTLGASFPTNVQEPITPVPAALATMRFVSIVEKDYAIFCVNNVVFYVGALIDLIVPDANLAAATPVGCFNLLNGGVPDFGALTRHPLDSATGTPLAVNTPHSLFPIGERRTWLQQVMMGAAMYLHPDRYQDKKVFASECLALMAAGMNGGNANNVGDKVGAIRGKFKCLRIASYPGAVQVFDTIVVDGRKHIVLQDHGNIDTGVFGSPQDYYNNIHWGKVFDTGIAA